MLATLLNIIIILNLGVRNDGSNADGGDFVMKESPEPSEAGTEQTKPKNSLFGGAGQR